MERGVREEGEPGSSCLPPPQDNRLPIVHISKTTEYLHSMHSMPPDDWEAKPLGFKTGAN